MKNERRSQIKAYISEHKSARIEDLAKQNPDVSLMTLRRDLAALEEEGFLVRVRGGAYINSTPPATQAEDLYSRREISNVEAKTIICEKALPFLEEKRSIFFDAGTTLMTLVRRIPDQDLVVFTSAPNIAMEIVMRTTMPQVSLLGGSLSRNTISWNICAPSISTWRSWPPPAIRWKMAFRPATPMRPASKPRSSARRTRSSC